MLLLQVLYGFCPTNSLFFAQIPDSLRYPLHHSCTIALPADCGMRNAQSRRLASERSILISSILRPWDSLAYTQPPATFLSDSETTHTWRLDSTNTTVVGQRDHQRAVACRNLLWIVPFKVSRGSVPEINGFPELIVTSVRERGECCKTRQQGIKPTSFKGLIGPRVRHLSFVTTLGKDMHKYQDRSDQGGILMRLSFRSRAHAYPT